MVSIFVEIHTILSQPWNLICFASHLEYHVLAGMSVVSNVYIYQVFTIKYNRIWL